jgi:hypothetical protein
MAGDPVAWLQRRRWGRSASVLGRTWHRRAVESEDAARIEDLRLFIGQTRVTPGPDVVVLGRTRDEHGEPIWVGLPREEFLARSLSTVGASGSGKSYGALSVALQLLRLGDTPIVLVDFKGELAGLVLEVAVPALLASGVPEERLLARLRVVRPFEGTRVPLLRITRPESVARDIQARSIATTLCAGVDDDFGLRMERIVLRLVSLLIELDQPLPRMLDWLGAPTLLQRDARRSTDPATRRYVGELLTRENRSSIDAVRSRLDLFLLNEGTRLALSAPSCLPFAECLESGLTVIDVGDPPAGAERLARFWSSVLLSRLTRAALARPVRPHSPQTLLILEEFQEGLGRDERAQFARLLSQLRWKRCAAWYINQQPAQIAAVDPVLLKLLRTNVALEMSYRCAFEDAKAMAHAMPADRRDRRAGKGATREDAVEQLTSLRRREFLLWPKERARAQVCRSPRIDMDALRAAADRVPEEIRERIRAGTVSIPADEVRATVARESKEPVAAALPPDVVGRQSSANDEDLGLG